MRLIIFSLMLVIPAGCGSPSESTAEPVISEESALKVSEVPLPNIVSPEPIAEPENLNNDTADETLDIFVVGVIAGDKGTAILRVSEGKDTVYRSGDEIMPNVTLVAVARHFILVNARGKETRLPVNNGWATRKVSGKYSLDNRSGFHIDASGNVFNSAGAKIGRINAKGQVIDSGGKVIGRINAD